MSEKIVFIVEAVIRIPAKLFPKDNLGYQEQLPAEDDLREVFRDASNGNFKLDDQSVPEDESWLTYDRVLWFKALISKEKLQEFHDRTVAILETLEGTEHTMWIDEPGLLTLTVSANRVE